MNERLASSGRAFALSLVCLLLAGLACSAGRAEAPVARADAAAGYDPCIGLMSQAPMSLDLAMEGQRALELLKALDDLPNEDLRGRVAFCVAEVGCLARSRGFSPVADRLSKALTAATDAAPIAYPDVLVQRHFQALLRYLGDAKSVPTRAGYLPIQPEVDAWEALFWRNRMTPDLGALFRSPGNAPERLVHEERYLRLLVLSTTSSRAASLAMALESVRNGGLDSDEESVLAAINLWGKALDALVRSGDEMGETAHAYVAEAERERSGYGSVAYRLGNGDVLSRYRQSEE